MRSFLLSAAVLVSTATSLLAQTAATLQLNWKPEPQFGGFYEAQRAGLFKQNNLDVTVQPGGTGLPTVQMLAAGTVDFAVVSGDELILANSNGIELVAIFAVYQTNPQGIMTHKARGFTSIEQVFKSPGVLAMQRGLPYASFLENKYGFGSLQIFPSPGGDLTVFRSNDQYSMQCFVTSEPIAAQKAGLETTTFLIADSGYNPYTTVVATRRDVIAKNPELVKSMRAAVKTGWENYLKDPTATNLLMQELNPGMDADTFKASSEAQKPLIETDQTKTAGIGTMTLARWEELSQQLLDLKVIEKKPDAKTLFVE
jgi:NitT/TauT family transport system substrate-binding protein